MSRPPLSLRQFSATTATAAQPSVWPLTAGDVLQLIAQPNSQFELLGSADSDQLILRRNGQQLQLWLDDQPLVVIDNFFVESAVNAPVQLFFTDAQYGALALTADAAAAEGQLWPQSEGSDDSSALPLWLCVAALIGAGGALGSASDGGRVDNTPPPAASFGLSQDTGISNSDLITQTAELQLQLAADAAYWQYSLDGGRHWQAGSGDRLVLATNTEYPIGAIVVRQSDAAGNLSATTSNSEIIVIDTLAPAAPALQLANDSGSSSSDGVTNDATVNVTLASDVASWQYRLQGGEWQNGSGSSFELADNSYYASGEIEVRQSDMAGNLSATTSNSENIIIDTLAPAAPALQLANDSGSSASDGVTNDATVNVTLASDFASWQYRLQGGEWQTGSGSSFELTANSHYASGEIEVRQSDMAGNLSATTSNSENIIIDTLATAAPALQLANDSGSSASDGVTNDATVNVTLASDFASWQYRLQGGEWQTGSGSSFELAANSHYASGEIEVRQSDIAGNLSAVSSNSSAITIDTALPSRAVVDATFIYSAVPAIDAPLPQYISGQATLAAGEQLNVTIGSQLFNDVAVSDGNWQIDRRSLDEFSGGESIEVTATVVDVAGNQITDTSSAEITVQYNDRVIFDLTTGQSSEHGVDRSFATDIDYNIFIIVDSDGVDMQSIATEQQWRSWNNLGSGDTIWLVGNNPSGEVMAFMSSAVTTAVVSSSALIWASKPTASTSQQAFLIRSSGVASRAVSSQSQTFQLFNSADGQLDASGGVAVNYLATIHAGSWSNIYTTQGLS
ncbi:hypothetical protein E3W66_08640 [Gammaproteobacteria bacterium LSUCC0057]|uniref:Bacterial Ig-like domain-containing protein n=1 Tax=Gammaproteobacteria bacterium LSUCC0057 TaxID=2559237 RepID=A0A4Y8UFC1_9GAMM|nr:hypothetical protein E3W66_08640 [Gammaproteobacteria bacterium LSUCC0057]